MFSLGGGNMDRLDAKLMKLFILADGVSTPTEKYECADLLYALLSEIRDIQPIYEEVREKILDMA